MRIKGKLENYARVDEVLDELIAVVPRGPKCSARPKPRRSSRSCRRRSCATRSSSATSASTAASSTRSGRSPSRSACCRAPTARRVHARRDPGAGHRHARHRRTTSRRSRRSTARRGSASCSTTTSRPSRSAKCGFLRGPGRREIGHGALAERALAPMMPDRGAASPTPSASSPTSSSRTAARRWRRSAAASLALMDAGVPIKAPVAGVAMGLILDEKTGKYAVLTDIPGAEDHYGDMDFKVAGTAAGITALQMDIKVTGVPAEIMRDGARSRPARAGCTSSARWTRRSPAHRHEHLGLRAAHRHDQDPGRQDPRRHRAGRQDDPLDHRADRREDRRRRTMARSTSRRPTSRPQPRRSASSRS